MKRHGGGWAGRWPRLAAAGLFLIGLCILLYPAVSRLAAGRAFGRAAKKYESTVRETDVVVMKKALQDAARYNEALLSGAESETDYGSLLNLGEAMGYLEIPSISLCLPIYRGTDDEVLQHGAGHLKSSSLPVGGRGTHAVLTGHSGIPNKTLFNDLEKLKLGDEFQLHVLGEVLRYRVERVLTVLPSEIQYLAIERERDYVTLVTCTPVAVNTHRLLVRGERIPEGVKEE